MRKLGQLTIALSMAYSLFVWFWAINAVRWGAHENWAAVATVAFGIWGLMIQVPIAAIMAGIMIAKKQLIYRSLSIRWNAALVCGGPLLSGAAVWLGFICG